jgi:hypothetical protein
MWRVKYYQRGVRTIGPAEKQFRLLERSERCRPLWIAMVLMIGFCAAAHAQCTPEGMARYRAADARLAAAKTRIRAGDCSAISEWKRALGAVHAILRRSQQQTYPYTCNVNILNPPVPTCSTRTAEASSAKKQDKATSPTAATQPTPLSSTAASGSGSCSDITGLRSGSSPSNCTPSNGVPPNVQTQMNQTQSNQSPPIKAPPSTSPPSKGEVLESLRDLMPDLGKLLDATADAVNSPNIPPPDQWTNVSTRASTANPSRPQTDPSGSKPMLSQNDHPDAPTTNADATPEQASPVQDNPDDDYAAICKSESVKNGLKSLKQDFEAAQKDEQGRFGIKFFREKLKLQWATLKKCVRDPMQKAVLDKLDRDPIILDPDEDNQQTITPK